MDGLRRTGSSRLSAPRDALRIATDHGSIAYWQLLPDVYASEVRGHMTPEMARLIIDHGELLYRPGVTVHGFHNWLYMTNYDSACRVELTAWVLRHRAHSVLHIGVTSRMVAMGVTVANLALGNLIKVHTSLTSLESELSSIARPTR